MPSHYIPKIYVSQPVLYSPLNLCPFQESLKHLLSRVPFSSSDGKLIPTAVLKQSRSVLGWENKIGFGFFHFTTNIITEFYYQKCDRQQIYLRRRGERQTERERERIYMHTQPCANILAYVFTNQKLSFTELLQSHCCQPGKEPCWQYVLGLWTMWHPTFKSVWCWPELICLCWQGGGGEGPQQHSSADFITPEVSRPTFLHYGPWTELALSVGRECCHSAG